MHWNYFHALLVSGWIFVCSRDLGLGFNRFVLQFQVSSCSGLECSKVFALVAL